MKKAILVLLSLLSYTMVYSQCTFYVIDDSDGYTNLRDKDRKVVGKLYDNDVFVILDYDTEQLQYISINALWNIPDRFARYGWGEENQEETTETDLFIHKSRIKSLDQLPQLKRVLVNKNKAIFYNDRITIEITTGVIDQKQRKITFDEEGHNIPLAIDGYKPHGIDWPLRDVETEIKSISYTIDGKSTDFEAGHIRGFLNISCQHLSISTGKNNTYYIYGSGGDGSGGYEVLWIIRDGIVKAAIAYSPY